MKKRARYSVKKESSRSTRQDSKTLSTYRTNATSNAFVGQGLLTLPDAVLVHIMSFAVDVAVDIDTFLMIQCVCKRFRYLANSNDLWHRSSHILPNGALNLNAFRYIKEKCRGTEGTCLHVYSRKDRKEYAIKKARVYPENEGVPYYMVRELAALRKISNKHICELVMINLYDFDLYLLFPYIEKTLHDYLTSGIRIQKHQVRSLTYQLLDAINYCHKRGIVHRNLKPKHLLVIPGSGHDPLDNAQIKLADFALVRIMGHPPKKFTSEVITLWYRPPEILMGLKDYTTAVDMWSIGCIFAEMIEGDALFRGLCEIDQLFQIFFKLGTPASKEWPAFASMPNYQPTLFPQWSESRLYELMEKVDDEQFALLLPMLRFDPGKRASANEALRHKYFDNVICGKRKEDFDRGGLISQGSMSEPTSKQKASKKVDFIELLPDSGCAKYNEDLNTKTNDQVKNAENVVQGDTLDRLWDDDQFLCKSSSKISSFASSSSPSQSLREVHFSSSATPKDAVYALNKSCYCNNAAQAFGSIQEIDIFDPNGLLYYHPKLTRLNKTTLQQNHFLRKLEGDHGIVSSNRRIDSPARLGIIIRLIDILEAFEEHMSQRTVFFAVGLLDRFASTLEENARRCLNLHLLGSTCLHIASKCEDVTYIGLKDLVPLGYEGIPPFDGKDILNLEERVLNALNFDLYLPTTIDFLNIYTDCVPEICNSRSTVMFARYIAEGSLCCSECMDCLPSLLAAAIVAYSLHCSHFSIMWSETLEAVTQYKIEELVIVMKSIYGLHERLPNTAYRTVHERYGKDKFANVSSWRPTRIDVSKFNKFAQEKALIENCSDLDNVCCNRNN